MDELPKEPRRETRKSIERALVIRAKPDRERAKALSEEIEARGRHDSRRRPIGMAPASVEPPRGPLALQAGAEAPADFGRE